MSKHRDGDHQPERVRHLEWVSLDLMRVSPRAQRDFKQSHADQILAKFDLEKFREPTVNYRDGFYYIVDGQHGTAAYKAWLGDWKGQKILCWLYTGLTEAQEADLYLELNWRRPNTAFSDFQIALVAEYEVECDIDRIVRANGLAISREGISAVGTLLSIYKHHGGPVLGRTLRLITAAYGDAGLEALILRGIAAVVDRFGSDLDDERLVKQLSNAHGGVGGLLSQAEQLHLKTRQQKNACVSAVAVKFYNRGRGPNLPSWWRDDD